MSPSEPPLAPLSAAPSAVARLARLLANAGPGPAPERLERAALRALYHPGLERALLGPALPRDARLGAAVALQRLATRMTFSERTRTTMIDGLDRLALRILAEDGLADGVAAAEIGPFARAEALLSLAAEGRLPLGRAGRDLVRLARRLLHSDEARTMLANDTAARIRILGLLEAAEAGLAT